jgi:ABC-type uncharacterized transport system ATPase subunit
MTEALVSLRGICKQFGTVSANQDIDFDIYRGRIHALLGENGAGKSTLMSILAGRYRADSGTITINGSSVSFSSPASALGHGIGMVYQRFMLIESMTVAENLLLCAHKYIGRKNAALTIQKTAKQYGLDIDPDRHIFELSMGERQRVEIIKLLLLDARVLIFDEPTAVLTPPEVDAFFSVINTLRNAGKGIVFITHKLEEVLKLADDISVIRKGRLIVSTQADKEQLSRRRLAQLMVGRDVVLQVIKEPVEPKDTVLLLENLSGSGSVGSVSFDNISFAVKRGEIFSIIGVAGNGQGALVEAITGLGPAQSGQLCFCGKPYTPREWLNASKDLIAYVPEDRYHTGCVGTMSIGDNSGLTRLSSYQSGIGNMFLDRRKMFDDCAAAIKTFNIKAQSPDDTADSLSGGNLQKVILARELSRKPQLFIAEQPTQGLDISATEDIWKALLECRKEAAVLLVSGDLKEVLSLSDRIGVIFNGRILEIIDAHDPDAVGRVGLLMAGVSS